MGNIAKRSIAVTATVAALTATGVAFAAWTSTGSGTATATAGSAATLTVAQSATATGLLPSGQVNVPIKITNTNPYQITISSLTAGTITVDATHAAAGCTDASVAGVSVANLTGLSDVLAGTTGNVTETMVMKMTAASANACQGATFTFTATATGASS